MNIGLIQKIMDTQEDLTEIGAQLSLYLIFDDQSCRKSQFKNETIRELYMNGRNQDIYVINSSQYALDAGPDIRNQQDVVIVCKDNIQANLEKLWKHFFGVFKNYRDFRKVFLQCTKNYECLVLDRRTKSNRLEDMLFWWKADVQLAPTQIHSDAQLQLHNMYHLPEHIRLEERKRKVVDQLYGGPEGDEEMDDEREIGRVNKVAAKGRRQTARKKPAARKSRS